MDEQAVGLHSHYFDRQTPSSDHVGRAGERWLGGRDRRLAALLVILASIVRWQGLGASYLWRDDAWQSLVTKADGVHEFLLVAVTAPGYAALLSAWFNVVGFTPTRAQLPAFLAGIVGPALVFLAARRLGVRTVAAFLAASILVFSTYHVDYSVRVKPFTLEVAIAASLLVFTIRCVEQGMVRARWIQLVALSIASTVFSAMLVPVVASCLVAAAVSHLRSEGGQALKRAGLALAIYGLFGALWWWVMLKDVRTHSLEIFWQEHFVGSDAGIFDTGLRLVLRSGSLFRNLVLPAGVIFPDVASAIIGIVVGVVVALGLYVAVRRDPTLALLLAAPVVLTAFFSLARVVPFGGGRTDLVLYPSLLIAMSLAFDWGLRRLEGTSALAARAGSIAFVVSLVVISTVGSRPYPPVPDAAPLVERVERLAATDDVIVIADGLLTYEIALVSSWDVSIMPSRQSMTGFHVDLPERRTIIVEEGYARPLDIEELRQDETAAAGLVQLLASQELPERVWVFGSMRPRVGEVLGDAGYRVASTSVVAGPHDSMQSRTLYRWELPRT